MGFWRLRHYRRVEKSALFQSYEYTQLYLRGSRWGKHPLLHYLLIGEAKGFLPNAMFDPEWVRDRHGCRGLGDYLAQPRFWPCTTSRFFDGTFYKPPSVRVDDPRGTSPLGHFWRHGFDENLDPSDDFDTLFYKTATSRDNSDKRGLLFRLAASKSDVPFCQRELSRRQEDFLARIGLRLIADARGGERRRNLVWVQCAPAFDNPFRGIERSFDVLLNYYDDPGSPDRPDARQPDCEIALFQKGTKSTGITKVLRDMPQLFEAYDYVLFLDDDVEMAPESVETLFETMATKRLDVAQPSLSPDSQTWFQDLKQPTVGPTTRPVSAVEIMAPCLSRDALARCGWALSKSISGWGADLLLSAMARRDLGSQPQVIGGCEAIHLRPFDTEHGAFYKFLMSHGIDANIEAGAISAAYGVDVDPYTAIRLL